MWLFLYTSMSAKLHDVIECKNMKQHDMLMFFCVHRRECNVYLLTLFVFIWKFHLQNGWTLNRCKICLFDQDSGYRSHIVEGSGGVDHDYYQRVGINMSLVAMSLVLAQNQQVATTPLGRLRHVYPGRQQTMVGSATGICMLLVRVGRSQSIK